MRFLSLIVLVAACTKYMPAPVTPKPTPNHARALAESFVASSDTKCMPWSGRETPYGGVDSMICVAPNQLIYVAAPNDGMPIIKIALQTESTTSTPPPEKKPDPPPPPPAPAPPKPEPKKK